MTKINVTERFNSVELPVLENLNLIDNSLPDTKTVEHYVNNIVSVLANEMDKISSNIQEITDIKSTTATRTATVDTRFSEVDDTIEALSASSLAARDALSASALAARDALKNELTNLISNDMTFKGGKNKDTFEQLLNGLNADPTLIHIGDMYAITQEFTWDNTNYDTNGDLLESTSTSLSVGDVIIAESTSTTENANGFYSFEINGLWTIVSSSISTNNLKADVIQNNKTDIRTITLDDNSSNNLITEALAATTGSETSNIHFVYFNVNDLRTNSGSSYVDVSRNEKYHFIGGYGNMLSFVKTVRSSTSDTTPGATEDFWFAV
jgi:hypothetical protein